MVSYSDSEVGIYHPLCEKALNNAINALGKNMDYDVVHHAYTGSLQMDLAIQNKITKKIFCVIEVKRTPADVFSTRYQYQGMSYVISNNAMNNTEQPFYVMTNLEECVAFRQDIHKTNAMQQMLKPGPKHVCNFKTDNETVIVNALTDYFKAFLGDCYNGIYDYLGTIENFINHISTTVTSDNTWKSSMAIIMYEYIRGLFNAISRPDFRYDVRTFRDDVERICIEANRVNFDGIFKYDATKYLPKLAVPNNILSDMYEFGKVNLSGDSIANNLHEMLSKGKEHDGEVATDAELANVVAVLAKLSNGELKKGRCICDPCAGSGSLLCASIDVFNINAGQLVANDVNKKLLELLSLRLGLRFSNTVDSLNSPTVSVDDITDKNIKDFENIDVVLLNPPFVAGINCITRKRAFFKKIEKLKGSKAATDIGQMNLGAVFLELICYLVKPETTVACIFPKSYLSGRGEDTVVFRKMLLTLFGLHTVFDYPSDSLFEGVMEETCVFVGKVRTTCDYISILSSNLSVADIDLNKVASIDFTKLNKKQFSTIFPGLDGMAIPLSVLQKEADDGWRMLSNEKTEAIEFLDKYIRSNPKYELLPNTTKKHKRGNVANSGGTDLFFMSSNKNLYSKYSSIPLREGMHNAFNNKLILSSGDSKYWYIKDVSVKVANSIINDYIAMPIKKGKQEKKVKSLSEWIKIGNAEASCFASNSILIPTKIRVDGKVYLSKVPLYVSTNFSVFSYDTEKKAEIIASYMSTIFYQLECEVEAKIHAGIRKNEVIDIQTTHVPIASNIDTKTYNCIKKELAKIDFVKLNAPIIRRIDEIWAEILFGTDAKSCLNKAKLLLAFLANRRNRKYV